MKQQTFYLAKRSNILVSLLFIIVAFAGSSCNKWLTLQPQDGITRQEYWQTKEQIQAEVIGCYSSMLAAPSGVSDKQMSEYMFVWGETRADMAATTLAATNDEQDMTNLTMQPTNVFVSWSAFYRTINYCNTVIKYAPNVLTIDNTLTQTQLNQWLAEVYGIRALMYFYLVRSFRDVPLKLTPTASDNDLGALPKSPADTILAQIVKDLAFAETNAVYTYNNVQYDKGRITKYSINAIQADVALWMEKYDVASAACDKIINSGKFGLIAGNSGWFNTLYYVGNSNESIFELQFDIQALNNFYAMFLAGTRRYVAAGRVMDEMYTVDPVNDQNKDIRGDGASVRTSDNAIWKFISVDYNTARTAATSYCHWFLYRYADVMLMKAEAQNELGNGPAALNLVYTVRRRANALPTSDAMPDSTNTLAVEDFILAERGRELAFEGKRWYDILRFAKRKNYARKDILVNMVAKTASADRQQSAMNKITDPNSNYFPILQTELNTDLNLVQNPFYK
jgi:hypothetical protein